MKCVFCNCMQSRVVDSRQSEDGLTIRRRRECENCGRRFTTYERIDMIPLMVVKKDQTREPFQADKLRHGIIKACEKRPVSLEDIDALVRGTEFGERTRDGELCRAELESRYEEIGGEAMLTELSQVDPERAAKLHPADKKRIVRAMEVFLLTGRTMTEHDRETQLRPPKYDAAYIILDFAERGRLYARIDARVDAMVAAGLFDEVERVFAAGVSHTAAQAIGYKEAAAALAGEITREEAVEAIKRESRRYAKRQLTWLRKRAGALWIRWDDEPDFVSAKRDSTAFLAAHGII